MRTFGLTSCVKEKRVIGCMDTSKPPPLSLFRLLARRQLPGSGLPADSLLLALLRTSSTTSIICGHLRLPRCRIRIPTLPFRPPLWPLPQLVIRSTHSFGSIRITHGFGVPETSTLASNPLYESISCPPIGCTTQSTGARARPLPSWHAPARDLISRRP